MALVQEIFDRDYDDARCPSSRRRRRADLAPDPVARSLARLGDQAAHAQPAGVHAGVQRLAREHPQPHPRAGVHHQALLPAGVGRRLAQPLQRRHHQRRARARAQVRGAAAGRQLPPRSGCEENGAWRTYKLRQDFVAADKVQMEDDITASVVVPARRLVGLPGRVRRPPQPQARAELRVPALPAPRRRDPSGPRQADRGGHGRARGSSARTSSRSPRTTRSGSSRTWRLHDAFTQPMREHVARNAARADGGYSICSAQPAAGRRQAHQEPALSAGAARPGATRATATSPRWARGSTAGCRCTRRCCSR